MSTIKSIVNIPLTERGFRFINLLHCYSSLRDMCSKCFFIDRVGMLRYEASRVAVITRVRSTFTNLMRMLSTTFYLRLRHTY